jgi:hypothetical protein
MGGRFHRDNRPHYEYVIEKEGSSNLEVPSVAPVDVSEDWDSLVPRASGLLFGETGVRAEIGQGPMPMGGR